MVDPSETFATPRVAAGALFFNDEGQVLLVHPTYKDTWDSYVERSESPAAACRRELAEELRLDRSPRRLLGIDWAPIRKEGAKLLFLFDCGQLGDDAQKIQLDQREIDRWQWVEITQLENFVLDRIARRIRSVAANKGSYMEQGIAMASSSSNAAP